MAFLERIWGSGKAGTQEEVVELTNQFYVTLRAYFAKIKAGGPPRNQEAFDRVEAILAASEQSWTNAYEVEQLLVHLFDNETLATELTVRAIEARSVLRPELAAVYDAELTEIKKLQAAEPPAGDLGDRRRILLARLVNDLQWRYIVNEATRRYSKLITSRTAYLSVLALMAFIGSMLLVYVASVRWGVDFTVGDIRLIWIAALAGMWGATFSMLSTLQDRLQKSKFDDLKLMKAAAVLLSRGLVGAGAACILFFFLLSGLLGGTAFPTLLRDHELTSRPVVSNATALRPTTPSSPAFDERLPARDLAMLIVWCFIAGFSERLIPALLASTEARANGAKSTTDRFQPTSAQTAIPAPPEPTPPAGTGARGAQPGAPKPREPSNG
jgi:hypothetical protein